ncbi:hypothetical protein EPUS_04812 [Endocarpon pusillum Z07020]|uniref:Methyltransferase n=1 Tax=Endocarpon pusillum (strain Z07020 / HMAS-L-300199) TaxID=1263415 RepID=U1HU12_ENDPU|nr:uncharacterized protein EPUS_04812 [Endocarpon pusillum Z07020]ERF72759.1 hypothetical protein EPUS_04812 [Endocarpon pusillum Z07020]
MSLQDVPDLPVTTPSLRFFQDDEKFQSEKPYHFSGPLEAHEESRRTNLVLATRENVPIRDIRECVSRPRLHNHGFQFEHFPSSFMDGLHESNVFKSYIEEVAHFVKNMEKAEAVICYDYRFRKSTSSPGSKVIGAGGSFDSPNEPAWQVHIDLSRDAGPKRLRYQLRKPEHEKYLNEHWRIRIINVWRPLKHVVRDAPLAFCDFTSVDAADLIATDRPSREYVGEVYYVRYNSAQRWYWLSEQTPDELSLFMSYDSDPGENGAALCPHSAFQLQGVQPPVERRESLEVRLIVITSKAAPIATS